MSDDLGAKRVLLREIAIKLYRMGATIPEISRLVGVSQGAVREWLRGSVPSIRVSERFWNGGSGVNKLLNHIQLLAALQNQILGLLAERGRITRRSLRRLKVDGRLFNRMMDRMEVNGWVTGSDKLWIITEKGMQEAKLRGLL